MPLSRRSLQPINASSTGKLIITLRSQVGNNKKSSLLSGGSLQRITAELFIRNIFPPLHTFFSFSNKPNSVMVKIQQRRSIPPEQGTAQLDPELWSRSLYKAQRGIHQEISTNPTACFEFLLHAWCNCNRCQTKPKVYAPARASLQLVLLEESPILIEWCCPSHPRKIFHVSSHHDFDHVYHFKSYLPNRMLGLVMLWEAQRIWSTQAVK